MRVIVTGSSGLIGTAVVKALQTANHEIFKLIRPPRQPRSNGIMWDPLTGFIDKSRIDRCDAIIHLAGENVAGRWTHEKKQRIYQSRIETTNLLYDFIAQLAQRPSTFIAASGISYCGDCGDNHTTETTPKGRGFLCDITEQREAAAMKISQLDPRVVMTRFAMVFSDKGGALKKLLPAFQAGLGGKLGPGTQYWPWVTLDDAVAAIMFALQNKSLQGPVNIVAPQSITNAQFTKALGEVLNKPTFCKKPATLLKILLGQFAEELLLTSNRATPQKLKNAGFRFQDKDIKQALEKILNHHNNN